MASLPGGRTGARAFAGREHAEDSGARMESGRVQNEPGGQGNDTE